MKTFTPTAKDEFIQKELELDRAIAALQDLRANHFNSNTDEPDWGHVGSAEYLLGQVREGLAHYNISVK